MDWLELLKLLFGQLGVVGTVCFIISGYLAYLHHREREDHKQTRAMYEEDLEARTQLHEKYIMVMAEVKTLLEFLARKPGRTGR